MLKAVIILNILGEHIETVQCYLWIAKDLFTQARSSAGIEPIFECFNVTFSFIIIFCTEKDDKDVEI